MRLHFVRFEGSVFVCGEGEGEGEGECECTHRIAKSLWGRVLTLL